MQLYVGCSGWSYTDWLGHFYPKDLEPKKYLDYYGDILDYVEIDSTFSRIPSALVVQHWALTTPDHFKFTAKMPQAVTHEKRLGEDVESTMHDFYESMMPLVDKLAAVLIQLPPSTTKKEGFKKLQKLPIDTRFRHALEVRHESWFDNEVYDFLKKNDICLAWSHQDKIQTPPVVTTDFIYVRFIGDQSITDGKIRKKRSQELESWAEIIKKLMIENKLKEAFVAANNHYAGFGPSTVNSFRKLLKMPEVRYYELGKVQDKPLERNQASFLDFK